LGTVVGGSSLVVLATVWLGLALGEAMQLHALLGLAAALGLAATTATWSVHERARLVAGSLAVAAGLTTALLVLAALSYFESGHHALDVVRVAASWVPTA
jgi:hypothetical protein